ncbi:MAG: carboxypeptidase regulatory-like domain-containing protein, partial [Planctomycetes bacterium]|nr:carboxypeptidase regulatory-like domain-containing protein [Planctomycetota bacterium]
SLDQEGFPDWVMTDAVGRFWIGHNDLDGRFRLEAARADQGAYVAEPIVMTRGREFDFGDLLLRGSGTLEGRVVDRRGDPVARVRLQIFQEALSKQSRPKPYEGWYGSRDQVASGDGLDWATAASDAEGRFRVAGLAPGRYFVLPQGLRDLRASPRECFSTGDSDLLIVVGVRRLVIKMADGSTPSSFEVGLFARVEYPQSPELSPGHWTSFSLHDGPCHIAVESGARVHVGLKISAFRYHEESVDFGPDDTEKTLLLAAPEDNGERGAVEIQVLEPSGAAFPGARAWLHSAGVQAPLTALSGPGAAGSLTTEFLPGRYLVSVDGPYRSMATTRPVKVPVTIRANELTRASCVLRPSARLRIRFSGDDHRPFQLPHDAQLWVETHEGVTESMEPSGYENLGPGDYGLGHHFEGGRTTIHLDLPERPRLSHSPIMQLGRVTEIEWSIPATRPR